MKTQKKSRVLLLFSGGLDSILAAKILQNADCEVVALTFETPFFNANKAVVAAKNSGIEIVTKNISKIHFKLLRDPSHGFGKNMNPCIDCHGLMFSLAKEFALKQGFQIIASGEVLGQRPFSQNKQALKIVEKIAELEVLRPLSAKLLSETSYEEEGLIAREKLLDFSGKNRKPQLALAKKFGIIDYPTPAGGCLLTDPGYSQRLRELLERDLSVTLKDVRLIKIGRFFPVGRHSFAMIGRSQAENEQLGALESSEIYLIKMLDFAGPTALLRVKKLDDFENIFPEVAKKVRSYGRASKNFTGEITFKIWGKIEKTRNL